MTCNPNVQSVLFAVASRRRNEQTIGRIANALEATFQIPPGSHLVWVLGDGSERNNREALCTWTRRELRRIDRDVAARRVPELADRLHRQLTTWDLDRGAMT